MLGVRIKLSYIPIMGTECFCAKSKYYRYWTISIAGIVITIITIRRTK